MRRQTYLMSCICVLAMSSTGLAHEVSHELSRVPDFIGTFEGTKCTVTTTVSRQPYVSWFMSKKKETEPTGGYSSSLGTIGYASVAAAPAHCEPKLRLHSVGTKSTTVTELVPQMLPRL